MASLVKFTTLREKIWELVEELKKWEYPINQPEVLDHLMEAKMNLVAAESELRRLQLTITTNRQGD